MSPPTSPVRRRAARGLTTSAAISFAVVFVVGSIGLLMLGYLPPVLTLEGNTVDTGVVLLFLPLCALAFATMAEVVRATFSGPVVEAVPPPIRTLSSSRSRPRTRPSR